jgi:hypothetical protein
MRSGKKVVVRSTTCWWRDAYVAAVLETDSSKVFARIADALIVIEARLDSPMGVSERLAMECARQQLRTMEADRISSAGETPTRVGQRREVRRVH